MTAFFQKNDIHCIPQENLNEMLQRNGEGYFEAVVARQSGVIRTFLRQGGYDDVAIFNEQTNKDAIVMDLLDRLVGYILNYTIARRSVSSIGMLESLEESRKMIDRELKDIAQGITPIQTVLPEPTEGERRLLGYYDRPSTNRFF